MKEAPGVCSQAGASSVTRPAKGSLGDGAWGLGAYLSAKPIKIRGVPKRNPDAGYCAGASRVIGEG